MANEPTEAFELRELSPDDKCRGFFLGNDPGDEVYLPLTIFLQKSAKLFHTQNAAKTYVFVKGNKATAYITLSCSQIILDKPPDGLDTYRYKEYPAIKIGKLAVDKHYRDSDLGSQLVSLAVAIVTEKVMPHVGCRFLIVDSHKSAVGFYRKRGFSLLETEENKASDNPLMFLDVGKLA